MHYPEHVDRVERQFGCWKVKKLLHPFFTQCEKLTCFFKLANNKCGGSFNELPSPSCEIVDMPSLPLGFRRLRGMMVALALFTVRVDAVVGEVI